MRLATLFSGGGGWEVGAVNAGLRPVLAVEYEPWIAAWHHRVFPDALTLAADVREVDYAALGRNLGGVDVLVASPPCQATSKSGLQARGRRSEEEQEPVVCDPQVGLAVLPAVDGLRPRHVLVENNAGYQKTAAFAAIVEGLRGRGYHVDHQVLRAEDYGVPSARERLFLRASLGRLPPWPARKTKAPWYPAIVDLLPSMPTDTLAKPRVSGRPGWQEQALRDNPPPAGVPVLVAGGNPSRNARGYLAWRGPGDVAWTTQLPKNTSGMRVLLPDGTVRRVSARGVARLQSFPDDYPVEELSRERAIHVLGNSVPPLLAAQLLVPFAGW